MPQILKLEDDRYIIQIPSLDPLVLPDTSQAKYIKTDSRFTT